MKSKAEIIDALKRCKEEQCHCNGCSYYPSDYCDGSYYCVEALFDDILAILIKSDFEVMKEILGRSRLYAKVRVDHYNQHDWSIISLDGYDGVDIEFDEEGNIL